MATSKPPSGSGTFSASRWMCAATAYFKERGGDLVEFMSKGRMVPQLWGRAARLNCVVAGHATSASP